MVANSKESFESAERFWSGEPSQDALEALVADMKRREALKAMRQSRPMSKEQEVGE
jgi:hypothetical protein